jgi:hypothetical protein
MVPDRLINHVAVPVHRAGNDRQVLLFHLARFELSSQSIVCLIVLGHNDHTTRIAVESMDDPRPRRPATTAQRTEMMGQRARQRAFPMSLRRVNDHAGRLVDDDYRVVFIKN